jgi:hypothetical protein
VSPPYGGLLSPPHHGLTPGCHAGNTLAMDTSVPALWRAPLVSQEWSTYGCHAGDSQGPSPRRPTHGLTPGCHAGNTLAMDTSVPALWRAPLVSQEWSTYGCHAGDSQGPSPRRPAPFASPACRALLYPTFPQKPALLLLYPPHEVRSLEDLPGAVEEG